MIKANFYSKEKDYLRCNLCHHFCAIKENEIGICGNRLNQNGKLYALNYGYPVAINIDPIEKKPLFHFMPGTLAYSIGTNGCNFKCDNCQNFSLSQAKNIAKINDSLPYFSPEKIIEEAIGNECQSIAYTYNEPTMFTEYAIDIMKLAHENNLKNVWVSNGFMSGECLDAIAPYLDAINVDLKSMDEDFYLKNCSAKLQPVLKNIQKIKNEQIHLEITTLIIPTLSDNRAMLSQIADFIANELDVDVPWHLTKFSPGISWKLQSLNSTGEDLIYEAYEIGKDAGLNYVYVGNMPGDQKENTYCPRCGELVIRRFDYTVDRYDNNGICAECDKNLEIVE